MKKIYMLFVAVILSSALVLSACGKSTTQDTSQSTESATVSPSTVVASNYLPTAVSEHASLEVADDYDTSNAVNVELNTLTAENAPVGTSYDDSKNVLTITDGGIYILSGTLNGAVSVDGTAEDIRIVLNNATIATLDSQIVSAIAFKQTSNLRVLTLVGNNTVTDSVGNDESVNSKADGAVVKAKKCSLIINGTGTLNVSSLVPASNNGIQAKVNLTILNATINVENVKNGIKADEKVLISGATISVNANNDGIKTDLEADTTEDAQEYSSQFELGYLYIKNSNITVVAGDDGIAGNNCLYISNLDSNTVNVTTNGGSPNAVTSTLSDNAEGKAIKAAGIDDPATADTYAGDYAVLVIEGGTFILNSNGDAISSKGSLIISGGTFAISTYDDGIHAEYLTKVTGGAITINKAYEGIEGASVEITGGTINLTAYDDGINAANADLASYNYYIYISGGSVNVTANGDGIDSNGNILIAGGDVYVNGPTGGGNGIFDIGDGNCAFIVTGGNIWGVGTSDMTVYPSGSTSQAFIVVSGTGSAGSIIKVTDSTGTEVDTYTTKNSYNLMIISLQGMTSGAEYKVYVNGTLKGSYTASTSSSSFGGQGGPGGQFSPGGGKHF